MRKSGSPRSILTTKTGRPFTGSNFRHHFGKAQKVAGIVGLTFHGLRYTAANWLAEGWLLE